jgi:L,D-transpeptidase ErfK/SrfK
MRSRSALASVLVWLCVLVRCATGSVTCRCEELTLPENPRDSVVGEVRRTRVQSGESLLEIARAYDIGHDQIVLANPHLNRWVPPPGSEVTIPSQYILPPGRREGIVINLGELRLYFFPPNARVTYTFPISIGDLDWRTPLGTTKVTAKAVNPSWSPPKSIKEEHFLEGEELPDFVPGGDPENPLGHFALRLGIPGYLIHGTNDRRSFGIGMRVSHGCIRLYPENMARLFELVKVGTPVRIIDQSVKVGWLDNALFVEIHRPLELRDEATPPGPSISDLVDTLHSSITREVSVQTRVLAHAYQLGNGIPTVIGAETGTPEGPP